MMDDLSAKLPDLEPGWVWLAGAGPGDPGLLSVLALKGLRQADAIVYDALVSPEILDLVGDHAELIYAGKRGGRRSPLQADISLHLVALAGRKKRVLRLKGGDPFVFGRGAEEALALVQAGVPFRVVPGISAGVGGLAYAGIPLTHRTVNSAVVFITGHDAAGDTPRLDWSALARGAPVLVVFMALSNLAALVGRLLAAGRCRDEPVAVISRATTPRQKVLETTLGTCVGDVERAKIEPPSMVVVGQVVRLRAGLDWWGALAGRTLDPNPLD